MYGLRNVRKITPFHRWMLMNAIVSVYNPEKKLSHDLISNEIKLKLCNEAAGIQKKNGINESFWYWFSASAFSDCIWRCGKSSSTMHKIHFRTRLTLTFHNIQINIHIYHDFFSVLAVVVARSFFISRTLWSRTCFSCRLLALEKYTTFLAIYTVSVCVLFFSFVLLLHFHILVECL